MSSITIFGHGYRVAVDPEYGANITGLNWSGPCGRQIAILRRCDDIELIPGEPSPVGCFPMAPFANRIDGGVFTFADRVHVVPVNRPDENVAIHGLSRFEPFETLSQADSRLVLRHRQRGDVFAYDLIQDVKIDPSGVAVRLTLFNRGRTMPFGIGLHPYFMRGDGARLQLSASARSVSDLRHLPMRFEGRGSGPEFVRGACLDGLEGYDAHYAGWHPRCAVLDRPDAGIRVMVTAADAFSNVHVYVPPSGDLVCIEPVSHVPDIHNRATLSEFGKLSVLGPQGVLSGSMLLSVSQRE